MQELERNLKATCEEFIMSVTKSVVDPMLSFVTKVSYLFSLHHFSEVKEKKYKSSLASEPSHLIRTKRENDLINQYYNFFVS